MRRILYRTSRWQPGSRLVPNSYQGIIWLTIISAGDHSRLALILYAPGSIYDDIVKRDLAAGTLIVADEDPGTESGATAGIGNPDSVYCRRALLALDNSTFCDATEETVIVS